MLMNKKEILFDYKKKIDKFKDYNKAYYQNSDPKVSDEEYDNLKNKILKLEKEYNFLKSKIKNHDFITILEK